MLNLLDFQVEDSDVSDGTPKLGTCYINDNCRNSCMLINWLILIVNKRTDT